jgi:hypothetical protein
MAVTVEYAGADSDAAVLAFGNQTSPADGVIMGCTISATGNENIRWNGVDLTTQLTLDLNVYNNRDFESRIQTGVAAATHALTSEDLGVSVIGLAAILSGCSGTYQHLYGNPAGADTPSLASYIGGKAIIMAVRRNDYPILSITSGGENLATEASINWPAFESFYMRLYSCDVTDTTLEFAFTGVAYEIVTLEPSQVDFVDWTEEIAGDGLVELEEAIIRCGSQSVKITADADAGANPTYISQSVATTPGLRYELNGWVYGEWKATITGDVNTDTDTGSAADWTEVSLEIIADDTTLTVRLEPADDSDVAYFDCFSLSSFFPAGWPAVKFLGTCHYISPSSGLFESPTTEVEACDWIGYLNKQEIGLQPILADKTADEVLAVLLAEFPKQPEDTDFDTGDQTFTAVFSGDDAVGSMASMFQKLARNERGRIYCRGDGTLVFEAASTRPANTTPAFTLDGTMSGLEVSFNSEKIYNIISLRITNRTTDAAADQVLWKIGGKGIKFLAGQTLTLVCSYTDAGTGQPTAGADVVDPEVADTFHFGTTQTPANDDSHADLSFPSSPVIGGSSISCELKNDGGGTRYLNEFNILGKRVTEYDSITITVQDDDSIFQVGNKKFEERLDLINDPTLAETVASDILAHYAPSHLDTCRITVLANLNDTLAQGLLTAEPSTRFTAIESVTGISQDFYIQRIGYKQRDTLLWVTIDGEAV